MQAAELWAAASERAHRVAGRVQVNKKEIEALVGACGGLLPARGLPLGTVAAI